MKRKSNARSARALAIATTVAATLIVSPAAEAAVTALPPHSADVAGKSIGEWTNAWWQWAFSLGAINNPFKEDSQAAADNGQAGPVFFLAGTAGGTVRRNFNVPADKYLLVPLLNYECSSLEGNGTTEPALRTCANYGIDLVDSLTATGIANVSNTFSSLSTFREETPLGTTFSFDVVPGNAFGVPPGKANDAVADGYWLMLAPVGIGQETIRISYGGGLSEFDFSTLVELNVPEPASLALVAAGLICLAGMRRRAA